MQIELETDKKLMMNMGNVRDANSIVCALMNCGAFKPEDENDSRIVEKLNFFRNLYHDWCMLDINLKTGFETPRPETVYNVDTKVKEMSDTKCVHCGNFLTKKEKTFCDTNDISPYRCYKCRDK